MTDPEHSDDFEAYLKHRTLLPNTPSADDRLAPSASVDTAVLNQAREAIKGRQPPHRAPRWAIPVALAATILLCLSVVMNISLNTNRPATAPLDSMEHREAVSGAIPSREVILPEAKVAGEPPRRPAVVAEASPDASATAATADGRQFSRSPADAASQSAASPTGSAGQPTPRSRALAKATPPQTSSYAPTTSARSAADAWSASAASPPAPSAARADVASAADAANSTAASSPSPAADIAREEVVTTGQSPASAKRKADALGAVPHPHDPKAWLRQIAQLRAGGHIAQADAEMRRFRIAFPTYPVKPEPPASSGTPN
jgi:hypothetical protein